MAGISKNAWNQNGSSYKIMRTAVFNYIECDYNRWRRHSACGGLSPEQFENQNLA
ncbi:ISEc16, orfB [Klebsiella pneumoniae RYC492]|nr:ISEc16, orfB [Klebsiella pneumoniae RYC492]